MNQVNEHEIVGLIAARLSPSMDVVKYAKLLEQVGTLGGALENALEDECFQQLKVALASSATVAAAQQSLKGWRRLGIGAVPLGDPRYPDQLLEIADPPRILFYRGDWEQHDLNAPALSIVGARRADPVGCDLAQHFGREISQYGGCVVSGLAIGIDGAAHRGTLTSTRSFSTIAVLGNGLETVYPRYHERLAFEILECGGLLISQFEPDQKPYPANFLNRNRIVAALSQGTLVIQASKQSGSLVTAKNAVEYGRELFVVPGSLHDSRFAGSNELLKHGAYLVTEVQDIWDVLPDLKNISSTGTKAETTGMSASQSEILRALQGIPSLHFDELRGMFLTSPSFFEDVLLLELEGRVVRLPGNMIALTAESRK